MRSCWPTVQKGDNHDQLNPLTALNISIAHQASVYIDSQVMIWMERPFTHHLHVDSSTDNTTVALVDLGSLRKV